MGKIIIHSQVRMIIIITAEPNAPMNKRVIDLPMQGKESQCDYSNF